MTRVSGQPGTTPRFYVEAHPGGGWTVRLVGHHAPVSRHDTEEEARAKADAYQRGVAVDPSVAVSAASGAPRAPDLSGPEAG